MGFQDSSLSICLSSLVILAASVFRYRKEKQTHRQTTVTTGPPRLPSTWIMIAILERLY